MKIAFAKCAICKKKKCICQWRKDYNNLSWGEKLRQIKLDYINKEWVIEFIKKFVLNKNK